LRRTNKKFLWSASSPEIKARFAELGATAGGEPPEQFRNYVMAEKQKWAQVASEAKIQPE
jgi:tripartite-type tricarboxylate transporter receptor subunit TctC